MFSYLSEGLLKFKGCSFLSPFEGYMPDTFLKSLLECHINVFRYHNIVYQQSLYLDRRHFMFTINNSKYCVITGVNLLVVPDDPEFLDFLFGVTNCFNTITWLMNLSNAEAKGPLTKFPEKVTSFMEQLNLPLTFYC